MRVPVMSNLEIKSCDEKHYFDSINAVFRTYKNLSTSSTSNGTNFPSLLNTPLNSRVLNFNMIFHVASDLLYPLCALLRLALSPV